MRTFKVLSAFYIKDKDTLLVAVEGRDPAFKRGAAIRDAFGREYIIEALAKIDGISPQNEERFTSFLVKGCADIGRLVQLADTSAEK